MVLDAYAGTNGQGAMFMVNPTNGKVDLTTGLRTVVSNFGESSEGATGVDVNPVVVANSKILALDGEAGTNGLGALFSVDPQSGNRTVLSDFGLSSQGTLGSYPTGLVVLP